MVARRALPAALLAALALAAAGCGEKEENITSSSTTTGTGTTSTVTVRVEPDVAEQRARLAASKALPKGFSVKPAAWSVSCTGGETGGAWTCKVRSGACRGDVIVRPPSGADANAITANAKGVGCTPD